MQVFNKEANMNRPNSNPLSSLITFGGEQDVAIKALRRARQDTPIGEYAVDADALRRARQGTPTGEYHPVCLRDIDGFPWGCIPRPFPERCWRCGQRHPFHHRCPIDALPLI